MGEPMVRVIAVDWSGRRDGQEEAMWLAEANLGQIVRLENGWTRDQVVAYLIDAALDNPDLIVGFDFAFSMPAWFVEGMGAETGPAFWEVVARMGEAWLSTCCEPFFGKKGSKSLARDSLYRETEIAAPGAKSTFFINGPGAVGVGSVRGMPHLSRMRSAGWRVWPFDPPGFPLVVEIYPRLLTGKVVKTAWRKRLEYVEAHFPNLDPRYMERAAGSEDAFDAAVSALIMDRHVDALSALPDLSDNAVDQLEGRIWSPGALS